MDSFFSSRRGISVGPFGLNNVGPGSFLRTAAIRDTCSSRQIRLSDHPCTWNARRTRAIVSTDFIPKPPARYNGLMVANQGVRGSKLDADLPAYGVNFPRRNKYLLSGVIPTEWEHGIPPLDQLRYSVTFRNFRKMPRSEPKR